MNQMINKEFLAKEIENYFLYEDNCDEYGCGPDIDDILDIDYLYDICRMFKIGNISIEENDLLYWQMVSILNSMDIEALHSHIDSEADILSYDPWKEHCDANFYGI